MKTIENTSFFGSLFPATNASYDMTQIRLTLDGKVVINFFIFQITIQVLQKFSNHRYLVGLIGCVLPENVIFTFIPGCNNLTKAGFNQWLTRGGRTGHPFRKRKTTMRVRIDRRRFHFVIRRFANDFHIDKGLSMIAQAAFNPRKEQNIIFL
ncbi:hypothetical protein C7H09_15740 [Marinobacter fuscus]|uniref:Uncharacterized protein n=1 Tax=Marinobacter fuscus TaxID=2109942 RepID=A0A2T1K4N9_9GAMM|nr:hypothetical protein C7H09_15740 [Marinobacter fuscus]